MCVCVQAALAHFRRCTLLLMRHLTSLKPPLACPILHLLAAERTGGGEEGGGQTESGDLRPLSRAWLECVDVPGSHWTMLGDGDHIASLVMKSVQRSLTTSGV